MAKNKYVEAYNRGKEARSKTKSHYGQVSKKAQQVKTKKKKKKKEDEQRQQSPSTSGGTARHRGGSAPKSSSQKTKKQSAPANKQSTSKRSSGAFTPVNSTGSERRAGAQRARNNSTAKKIGNVATGTVIAPVKSYGYHTAKNATDAAGWASKNAYKAKENSRRNGSTYAPTKNDRKNATQKQQTTDFYKKQKETKAKTESKEFKAEQKAYAEPFKKTSKKLEKKQDKTLEKGAKALGLSDEKSIKVPKNKLLNKFVPEGTEFSATDIYKGANKAADELADYLIPYGGTTKGAFKAAEGIMKLGKGGKALTTFGEGAAKGLAEGGKKYVREAVKEGLKNGDDLGKILKDVSKNVAKSDFKQNVKKELIANAVQDVTLGTTIDALKGKQQGLEGKEFAKYMGENAMMNAAFGMPISLVAGRTGKAGKQALKNEIGQVAEQTSRAVTEENRLARRLGAKGYSLDKIQNALSKQDVKDYVNLAVKDGKKTLTVEQKKHLEKLTAKVEAQKTAYDNAITESVQATRQSIGKASAIDVSRLRRAVSHYETTGNTAMAKETRTLLKQAEKNFENTLDTVTKAAAKVSNDLGRQFKVESADEILDSFAKTGGRVDDPSQFHGFAEFDKDGNIIGYHVNKDSEQAMEFTFGHEFTHGFESLGKDYDDFVEDIKTFVGDEWDEAVELASRDYANVENADFEKEAVANLVAKHFFSEDGAYLKKLAGENPSMFAKIYNVIKKLLGGVSEHDAQFEALSKRMDEMFDMLSERDKSIALGSPDSAEMLHSGGRTLQDLIDDGINTKVAKELQVDLANAKNQLLDAIKETKGNYKELARRRREIFQDTGWFEGYDGKWRYEIDDSHMKYNLGKGIHTTSSPSGSKYLVVWDSQNGKIVPASIDKVHEAETRLYELRGKAKLTKKETNEVDRLSRELALHKALTDPDGVPLGKVLNHFDEKKRKGFFDLYPEAQNINFKLSTDGDFHDWTPTNKDVTYGKWNDETNTLTINAHIFAKESGLSKELEKNGIDPDFKVRETTVHEMQHYIQDYEGFSRGGSDEEFMDAGIFRYIPKVYDRDAPALNKLEKIKEDAEDLIVKKYGADVVDDFEYEYRHLTNDAINSQDDVLIDFAMRDDATGFADYVYNELKKTYKFKSPSKEFDSIAKDYLEADFKIYNFTEDDPKAIYSQLAGEQEARDVGERVNMSETKRRKNIPIKEGENVRYAEAKEADEIDKLNKLFPNRKTRNETGYTRLSKGDNTRKAQTEDEYYESLAADLEASENELYEAQKAYNPADSAPKKGQMTEEVRAQVKAQKLGGKELTDAQVDTLAEAQVALHNTKVIIPESAQTGTLKQIRAEHGIAEDNVMLPIVKSSTAKNAQSVADGYASLSKEYPDLFPSSITDEAEQFQRLIDVSGLKGGAQSRRGNYYVPKNRAMVSEKNAQAIKKGAEGAQKAIKDTLENYKKALENATTDEERKAIQNSIDKLSKQVKSEKPKQAKPKAKPKTGQPTKPKAEKAEQTKAEKTEQPKSETPKETEKNGMIDRERRENTKKRENETAKKAFKTLDAEYKGEQGWVDAVTGKRENGAFGKLKVRGLAEAESIAKKEMSDLGYDKMLKQYFTAEAAEDPNLTMARANQLLGEIDRKLKAGDGEAADLYDEATDIIEKYSGLTSLGSHILTSAKKFLTSTPQGRKRVVYKEIERLEKRYKDRIKGGKLIVDEKKIDELMNATGDRADELLDEINMEIWNQIPASLMERLNEYRHCFMLFNVKTHGRNIIGNSVFRMARALSDEMEQKILNSNAARKRIAKMQGGKEPADVVINKQHVTHKEINDNIDYLEKEFHAIYDKSGSRNKFIETGRPDGVPTVKFKLMQKAIDLNYYALEKEDLKWALKPAFNKSYIGYCKARCAKKLEIDPKDVKGEDLRKFMDEMTPAQKEKAQRFALEQGEYATFRDSCAFSDWLTGKKQTFAGKKGNTKWGTFGYRALDAVLEGALPFVKTPVNIFRRSVDFSPASLIMCVGKLARAESPEMFQLGVHQLCTGLTGTGAMGVGVFLANGGLFGLVEDATVQAGEVSGDAYYDRDMGYQDYSMVFNLGSKQYSWTMDWASPMNMSLFAGVAFKDAWDKRKEGIDNTTALNAFFALTSPITDMSFMSSPKDTVERFMENASRGSSDGKELDFAGAMAQLIVGDLPKNYVSGFFPQLTAQLAGAMDETRRDTKSTRENVYLKGWESSYRQLINKIPWAREKLLNPKLNREGQDVQNDENVATRILNSFFNPASVREITTNDTDRELIDIRNHIENKDSNDYKYFYYNFTGNPSYDLVNGKRMTYKDSYIYAKANRIEQNERIKTMLDADSYKGMTWKMKADEVDKAHWIGKTVADMETYNPNYAMKALLKDEDKEKEAVTEYKRLTAGDGRRATEKNKAYLDYYIEKERMISRSHASNTNEIYRIKGLAALQTGDKALLKSQDIEKSKLDDVKHYWDLAKEKYGKKAKTQAFKELTDGCCVTMSNCQYAGVKNPSKGVKSVSAGMAAAGYTTPDGVKIKPNKIDEMVYRFYGHNWNSAQSGGGLMLKYNKDGKYSIENIQAMKSTLRNQYDLDESGKTNKKEVIAYIDSLGIKSDDEKACLYEVLYSGGNYRNPYKSQIDDHLEWGDNRDDEWGDGSGGRGRGRRGRRGWGRRGGGGSGGGGGEMPNTASGAFKGKVTDPFSTSDTSKPSKLDDAYRKKAKKLAESSRKKFI